jgi:hypothetical protein
MPKSPEEFASSFLLGTCGARHGCGGSCPRGFASGLSARSFGLWIEFEGQIDPRSKRFLRSCTLGIHEDKSAHWLSRKFHRDAAWFE